MTSPARIAGTAALDDRALLERRARQLAQPLARRRATGRPLLVWELGETRLGLDAVAVRAVRHVGHLTRLPVSARPLTAVLEDRGDVVPVVPAHTLLADDPGDGRAGFAVLVEAGAHPPLGLLVDDRPDLVEVAADDLGPVPEEFDRPPPHLLEGISATGIVVVDADALLTDPTFTVRTPLP